ncbi:uncharacterized protein BP01DRAFT_406185 [Aspergillus saccharolyticus JOP 1030-1]|uniref:Uncharacterized protein n=1 Tax=Aspergillus saccharolyticus JOP 1030-1 TaxID=1450539 RepID=A0A318ZPT3_9EURO|nr:hypothetical protein BP01DRAFT_406185 [Aspergillus saccharolyticus JOP 1030-1]PYH48645.1 hypothetical protein BP01DRAFT_406185 [Aspergillus saccharolyticus JOP 1030-1]
MSYIDSCADEIVFSEEILTPPNGQPLPLEMATGILTKLLHCNRLFEQDPQLPRLLLPVLDLAKVYGVRFSAEPTVEALAPFCAIMADILFRIPGLNIALDYYHDSQKENKIYVDDFRATCPFPGWPITYGKSVHAVTDLFFFDPAGDLVPVIHREDYLEAVRDTRRVVLSFMRGEVLWEEFTPSGAGESTGQRWGPVYTITNGSKESYTKL